jgi:uncharacterized protein (TIGR02145 family)
MDTRYLEAGEVKTIIADVDPDGRSFLIWTGDTAGLADVNNRISLFTMPAGNATLTANYSTRYGLLYNYPAIRDTRNIAAPGWRLPTYNTEIYQWSQLPGGWAYLGNKIKEVSINYWRTILNNTNFYEMNFRGSGNRNTDGSFVNLKEKSSFWLNDTGNWIEYGELKTDQQNFATAFAGTLRPFLGLSIRLCRTAPGIANGVKGFYTGNNLRIYRTVVLNQVEWLSENLAETKFRNGDTIPEITSNSAWNAATTSALCAYGNNYNNV